MFFKSKEDTQTPRVIIAKDKPTVQNYPDKQVVLIENDDEDLYVFTKIGNETGIWYTYTHQRRILELMNTITGYKELLYDLKRKLYDEKERYLTLQEKYAELVDYKSKIIEKEMHNKCPGPLVKGEDCTCNKE